MSFMPKYCIIVLITKGYNFVTILCCFQPKGIKKKQPAGKKRPQKNAYIEIFSGMIRHHVAEMTLKANTCYNSFSLIHHYVLGHIY